MNSSEPAYANSAIRELLLGDITNTRAPAAINETTLCAATLPAPMTTILFPARLSEIG